MSPEFADSSTLAFSYHARYCLKCWCFPQAQLRPRGGELYTSEFSCQKRLLFGQMDYTLEPNVTVTDYYPDDFTIPCDTELVLRGGKLHLAIFYCILFVLGLLGNSLVILVLVACKKLAIVHAVYAVKVRTRRVGTALSLVVWLIAIAAATPWLVFYQVASDDGVLQCFPFYDNQSLRWKLSVHFEVNILGLLLPVAVLLFCYARILHQLRACQIHNRTRAVKLVLIVVIATLLFWVPFNAVLFLTSLHDMDVLGGCATSQRLALATHVTEVISFAHCCVNPVIYAFIGEKFKKNLASVFQKSCSHISLYIGRQVPLGEWERQLPSNQRSCHSSTLDYIL